jgi:hypothetical protein
MKIPEMQRLLKEADADPKVKYALTFLQEQIVSQQQQLDIAANVLVNVVNTLEKVQRINIGLNDRWERQLRGEPDVEIVQSVLPEPEN